MLARSERDNLRGPDRGEGHISLISTSGNNGAIGKVEDLACSGGTSVDLAIVTEERR